MPEPLAVGGALLMMLAYEQGRSHEMVDAGLEAAKQYPDLGVLRALIAFLLTDVDRLDEARALFAVERASGFRNLGYDINFTTTLMFYADCAVALGDGDAAAVIREHLAPFASSLTYNNVDTRGVVSRALGRLAALLGDDDSAEHHFRHAIEVHAAMRAPFLSARTQVDYAEFLMSRAAPADLVSARSLARSAAATAADHGYAGLGRRAARLLGSSATDPS